MKGFNRRFIALMVIVLLVTWISIPATAVVKVDSDNVREYAAGEVLVKMVPGVGNADQALAASGEKLHVKKRIGDDGVMLMGIGNGRSVEQVVAALSHNPKVEVVEPNYKLYASDITVSDSEYGELWGMNNVGQSILGVAGVSDVDIDAPEAWALQTKTDSVIVGVIDTGVDINHPDLKGHIWTNPADPWDEKDNDGNGKVDDTYGWDFFYDDGSVFDNADDDAHGTHVSGTITGVANDIGVIGVTQNVQIMSLKFIGPDGGYTSDAIDALAYAKSKGVKITNNSWGGGSYSTLLYNAIRDCGGVFVVAAGNDGRNIDRLPSYPASYNCTNILSVAAVENTGALAYFSNYGVKSVDVGAPGRYILSSVPGGGYAYYSGTSMATPHVAGIAAMLLGEDASLSVDGLISTIKNNGKTLASLTGKTVTGKLVSAGLALAAVVGTTPVDPPEPPPTSDVVSVVSTVPLDNARNVKIASNITVTFDRDVEIVGGKVIGVDNETTSVTSEVSESKGVVTINPSANLSTNTTYTVTIEAGAVKDASEGSTAVNEAYTFKFTTGRK